MNNVEKAIAAWGEPPRYIMILAEHCDRSSQRRVADQAGLSSAYISKLINRCYEASYDEAERIILARFSGDTVTCPIFGAQIALRTCIRQRRYEGPVVNMLHRQWRLHCPNCPHNLDGDRK